MKQIIANTFTPTYDLTEDRIRLSINYQDMQNRVDFMITRSFILNLLPSAEEFVHKHYGIEFSSYIKNNIEEIKQTKQKELSDTDMSNLELFKIQDELLREVNFSIDPKTRDIIVKFSSSNTVAIASFDVNMFEKLFSVIKASIPFIKWGVSLDF